MEDNAGWQVQEQDDGMVHVWPVDDLMRHTLLGTVCQCQPILEIEDGNGSIVHNSFDHREMFEPNNRNFHGSVN